MAPASAHPARDDSPASRLPVLFAAALAGGLAGASALRAQGASRPAPPPAAALPAVVAGRVLDAANRPVAGASVTLEESELAALTDARGAFVLHVDFVDSGVVAFRRVGFAPALASVRLARGDTLRLVARLAPVPRLDAVRTVAANSPGMRLAEFEARRRRGRGVFVTREEIERRGSVGVDDVLRWSGAVRVVDSAGVLLPVARRGVTRDRRRNTFDVPCVMRVAVDGIVAPPTVSLRDLPSPKEIDGIEIYVGPASLPPEFSTARADRSCGLVVVWTRER